MTLPVLLISLLKANGFFFCESVYPKQTDRALKAEKREAGMLGRKDDLGDTETAALIVCV